jgi:hypothetical protein
MNENFNKVNIWLNLAKNMTEERLARFPDYGPYLHARDQIDFISRVLERKLLPSKQEMEYVDIALMAIKELDASEPDYSEALCELSYWFKKLN